MRRVAIVTEPIDPSLVLAEVAAATQGASILFVGTVRDLNDGKQVGGMDYTFALRGDGQMPTQIVAAASHFVSTN